LRRRVPDTSKIKALMGWQPTIPLDQMLDEVIAQFRDGKDLAKSNIYCHA